MRLNRKDLDVLCGHSARRTEETLNFAGINAAEAGVADRYGVQLILMIAVDRLRVYKSA